MNRCTQPLLPLLTAIGLALSAPVWAFSFEDVEKLEAAEQQELLELARRAAAARNFTQARSYIDQARHKGYNPQAIQAAENVYKLEYAAFEEQKRREEAERQARLAAAEAARRTTSSDARGAIFIRYDGYRPSTGSQYVYRCRRGGDLSVFVNGSSILVFGASAYSTTTHQDTHETAANKACNR